MKQTTTPDTPSRILIVEDDKEIAYLEQDYLENAGYVSEIISNGTEAVPAILKGNFDLILLDVMLPGKDGCEVCREVRALTNIPILMVTARAESTDKIQGLGLGANDYIVKPFDPAELIARVGSHLAQYHRMAAPDVQTCLCSGDLTIYPKQWTVYKKSQELRLPNREFELLVFLAEHPDQMFSKYELFEKIWGYEYVGDTATVMVHIGRIRDKIEDDPQNPVYIETVRGAGYRFRQLPPSPEK